ncbi:MAG: sulfatase [Candidatus Heimdallarchaeota archaeon]
MNVIRKLGRKILLYLRGRKQDSTQRKAYNLRKKLLPTLFTKYGITKQDQSDIKHVIIVVVDSLRYGNLKFSGYSRDTTPFLSSMKNQLAIYKCITNAPWTYPSVASMLTGLFPYNHGVVLAGNPKNPSISMKLHSGVVSLLDIFELLDYKTFFSSSIPHVFRSMYASLKESPVKTWIIRPISDDIIFDSHLEWINENKDCKTFSYLHLEAPHIPIEAGKYTDHFGKIDDADKYRQWEFVDGENLDSKEFKEYTETRLKLYDASIVYMDAKIKELYNKLKNLGIYDSTLLVITADHGEEFWEHAKEEKELFYVPREKYGVAHGHNLWNEILTVPLIFMGKNIPALFIEDRYASSIDMVPTILSNMNVQFNAKKFDGIDLFSEQFKEERYLIAEGISNGYDKRVILNEKEKFLSAPYDNIEYYFDLVKDPKEKEPITSGERFEFLKAKLEEFARLDSRDQSENIGDDKRVENRLRNLGYLD